MPRPASIKPGDRFGLLVAIERVRSDVGELQWRFVCDCGNEVAHNGQPMRRGTWKSCGCRKNPRGADHPLYDHGKRGHRVYRIWNAMKQRCHNPKQPHYKRYGGLGVSVCEKWRSSFAAFYEDMGDPPSDSHSIDRIDPFGNYEPGNCRWATPHQQRMNQRSR